MSMEYRVLVKPNKRNNCVYWQQEELLPSSAKVLIVETKEPPIDGKANKKTIELISEFFDVPKSRVRIKKGFKTKSKIIIVD